MNELSSESSNYVFSKTAGTDVQARPPESELRSEDGRGRPSLHEQF